MRGLIVSVCVVLWLASAATAQRARPDRGNRSDRARPASHTFNSRYYRITTDVADKDFSKAIALHMDVVFEEYTRRMTNFRAKDAKAMPLYVWSTQERYIEFLNDMGLDGRNTGGVFFRGFKGDGLATFVAGQSRLRMFSVLQHEGFHQFASARISKDLPPWVNEGLAEYFGEAVIVDGKLAPGKLDGMRQAKMVGAIDEKDYVEFEELMTMDAEDWSGRVTGGDAHAGQMYDMAWSVCFFLVHADKAKYRDALEEYLDILSRNRRNSEAFDKVFGRNVGAFEKAWATGFAKLESDPWFTSIRRVELYAEVLRAMHAKDIKADSFDKLRDIVSRASRDADGETADFPEGATVELLPGDDDDLPPGLTVKGLKPTTIKLAWRLDKAGNPTEVITWDEKTPKAPPAPRRTADRTATTKPATTRPIGARNTR